jgi:hypothetical protein
VWEEKKTFGQDIRPALFGCVYAHTVESFFCSSHVCLVYFFFSLHKKEKSRQRVNGKKNCFDALFFKGGQKGTSSHRCFSFPREFR